MYFSAEKMCKAQWFDDGWNHACIICLKKGDKVSLHGYLWYD